MLLCSVVVCPSCKCCVSPVPGKPWQERVRRPIRPLSAVLTRELLWTGFGISGLCPEKGPKLLMTQEFGQRVEAAKGLQDLSPLF